MRKRLAIMAFCLLIAVSSASTAPPLTDNLPGGSLAYVGWAGSNLTFDGSMFGQMVREPSLVKLLGSIRTAIEANMPEGTTREMFQGGWELAAIAWSRPCAAALIDLTFDESGEPAATVAVLIDLGNKREQFIEHLDTFVAAVSDQYALEFETVTVDALTYKRLGGDIPLCYGFMGDVFFVTYGEGAVTRLIDLSAERTLSADEKFSAAYKAVAGESVQMASYVDVAGLIDLIKAAELPGDGDPSELSEFKTALATMGLDKVTTIVGAIRVLDRGLYSRIRIESSAPHRGVLMLTAGAPLTDDDLSSVPADADYFAAARLSPSAVYDELREIIKSIEPSAGAEFQAVVDKLNTELGLSITDDVLACLGDSWVVCSAPSQGGFITGTVLTVTVTDAEKLVASIAKIEKYIAENLPPGALKKTSVGRAEVHYVSFAGQSFVPVAPAWAIYEGRFYLALWPQVIQSTIQNTTTPIVADAKFVKWRAMVADKPSVLTYSNLPKIARQLYNIALLGWTVAAGQIAESTPISASPDWLPALSSIEKYLWPNISTVSADATGVTLESYGSLPLGGLGMMGPTSLPLGMSVLMPSLGSVRQQAQKALSMSNLHMIAMGIAMYTFDHDDEYPPDLAALLKNKYLDLEAFISPVSGREAPKLVDGELIGEIDYIYIKLPANATNHSELIIAYERLENYMGEGTCAAFADGHVEWMDREEFDEALKRTHELIKANSPLPAETEKF